VDGSRVAAIDCGTNSVRLLVGSREPATGRLQIAERHMRITRLGRGVDAAGRLDAAAVDRTLAVLGGYRQVMDAHGVTRVRATATSAARDATGAERDRFFDGAEKALGVGLEVLSGEEEAALSFAGAVSELDPAEGPFVVVDIGGGSTEFSFGSGAAGPEAAVSLDIGCVRLTEQFLHADPPGPEELLDCLSVVDVHLDDVARALPDIGEARTFVGLAGTVTTAAAVEIGLDHYDRDRVHHFRLTKAAVEDVFRTLATETLAERVGNPGLEPERADVIVGGLCVLVRIMRRFGFDPCLVSEADILDGLALSLLDG
jgi:exopolyphosphatase/guanosine-5'-triphosphate,3'-diphosphate pyrophosphatase